MSDRDPRTLAFAAIRDGEAWNDRRLPEMGRALNDALDRVSTLETALRDRETLLRAVLTNLHHVDPEWKLPPGQRVMLAAMIRAALAGREGSNDA